MSASLKKYVFLFTISLIAALLASLIILKLQGKSLLSVPDNYIASLTKSAESGNGNAAFRLGNNYRYGYNELKVNYAEAIEWYQVAINLGDADAMNNLGTMYRKGEGVEQNYREAKKLFEKSAELDNANAQLNLARIYAQGMGVQQDYKKAFNLYMKSAEQDNAISQYAVGYAYSTGQGIDKNLGEGCRWYEKAAEKGQKLALHEIAKCYFHGAPGFERNIEKAGYWYRQASKNGNELSVKFLNESDKYCGNQHQQMDSKAVSYCLVAANSGYAYSQTVIAGLYLSGYVLKQDHEKAIQWYEKAARQGSIYAQTTLSKMYAKGESVQKDTVNEYMWSYVAAHSSPKSEFEEKLSKEAASNLAELESMMNENELELAKKNADRYLVGYGNVFK